MTASYLEDRQVTLRKGDYDEAGAAKYGRPATAPGRYVTELQTDLSELGFACGGCDGAFGEKTESALRAFQRSAAAPERYGPNGMTTTDTLFAGETSGCCDEPTRAEIARWKANQWRFLPYPPALAAGEPPADEMGVPFAPFDPNAVLFWPVRTANPEGRTVPYRDVNGRDHGLPGRRFLADRPGRHHVGVDLYGNEGDPIVACESGVIVACYDFLKVQDGALPSLQALLIQGDSGLVINYGEIRHGSMGANGRKTGDRVAAGDVIAQVGMTTSSGPMCHFETYQRGTTANKRWMASTSTPPGLYNPTALLLHLAQKGR